jgi:hypothetical protein
MKLIATRSIAALLLGFLALSAFTPVLAQVPTLSPARLALTCTAVKADSSANASRLAGDTISVLAWLNADRTPAVLAWRTAVTPQEADEAANYTTFDSLTAGKRDSWRLFLGYSRDYSRNRVRTWVTDVWGAATAASVAEAVLQAGTANAKNVQVAVGGTVRTTGTVSATDYPISSAAMGDATWLVQPANCN